MYHLVSTDPCNPVAKERASGASTSASFPARRNSSGTLILWASAGTTRWAHWISRHGVAGLGRTWVGRGDVPPRFDRSLQPRGEGAREWRIHECVLPGQEKQQRHLDPVGVGGDDALRSEEKTPELQPRL